MAAMSRWVLACWLALAFGCQMTLALYGMLSRYLMTKANPPVPALRLVLLANLIAEATLLFGYSLPAAALCRWRAARRVSKPRPSQADLLRPGGNGSGNGSGKGSDGGGAQLPGSNEFESDDSEAATVAAAKGDEELGAQQQLQQEQLHFKLKAQPAAALQRLPAGAVAAGQALPAGREGPTLDVGSPTAGSLHRRSAQHAARDAAGYASPAHAALQLEQLEQAAAHGGQGNGELTDPCGHLGAAASLPYGSGSSSSGANRPPLAQQPSTLRPEVPMRRGLSMRFDALYPRHPAYYKALTVATLTAGFLAVYGFQAVAPGFVDPSLPQLVMMFSVLFTALVQALLLRRRLPLYTWPCAACMLGGACMVIVPNLSQSTAGSLNTSRGWVGFAFSVGSLVGSVVYLVVIQATRHLGLKSEHLNHAFFLTGCALFAALSLPIDGADWAAQLGPWSGGDWCILLALGTVCYLGSAAAVQHCVWALGAATTAMFFALRLVFTVALSTPILGATIIQTGVQIAGVVVTAGALTIYMGLQWRATRQAGAVPGSGAAGAGGR